MERVAIGRRGGQAVIETKYHRAALAVRGLTSRKRRYLAWYADHPRATMRECAASLGVSRGAVCVVLRGLQTLGLVTMSAHARSVAVTSEGFAALKRPMACRECGRPLEASS